jgi:acrylyl-CoA reductase (NADPH)
MSVPDSFPAFLATQRDDAVDRGPATLARDDLGDGEVTVRVEWSSINYKDALATIRSGQVARISPLVPGIDLAGEVVASDSDAAAVGEPVLVTGYDLGVAHHGGWARYARVPADWVVALPDGLSPRDAMALGTAGLTAGLSIHALEAHGLTPADGPVLVLGASGGVGSTAVGALATAGYEVWAATGKAAEHEYLRGLGAHEILTREEATAASDRPLEKMRWAAAVDPVGGAGTAYALRTTRYGGAVALSGLTAGTALPTTVLPFILRSVSLLGIDSVAASAQLRREVWARLAGDLRPRGLDGIEPVLDALLAGEAVGRTVVRLPDD